jgi:hypothetical protein
LEAVLQFRSELESGRLDVEMVTDKGWEALKQLDEYEAWPKRAWTVRNLATFTGYAALGGALFWLYSAWRKQQRADMQTTNASPPSEDDGLNH